MSLPEASGLGNLTTPGLELRHSTSSIGATPDSTGSYMYKKWIFVSRVETLRKESKPHVLGACWQYDEWGVGGKGGRVGKGGKGGY